MEPASVTIKRKRALRLAFSVVVSLRPSRWDRYLGITAPMTQVPLTHGYPMSRFEIFNYRYLMNLRFL